MQVGKVYYVHLREQDSEGEYVNNSGATIAWMVNEEGNLLVGRPAVCYPTDKFVKAEGRKYALEYFNTEDSVVYLPAEHIASLAISQSVGSLNFADLTPSARLKLFNFIAEEIEGDVGGVMSTSWFEALIRTRFYLEGGHLRANFDDVMFAETMQIIQGAMIHNSIEDTVCGVIDA